MLQQITVKYDRWLLCKTYLDDFELLRVNIYIYNYIYIIYTIDYTIAYIYLSRCACRQFIFIKPNELQDVPVYLKYFSRHLNLITVLYIYI